MAIGVSAGLGRFALRSRGESEDCGTRLFPDELCPLLRPAPDSGGRHLASCGADAAPRAIPIVAHLLEPFAGDRAHNAAVRLIAHFGSLGRSEEHTSELQSLMRISYAVFCLKQKKFTLIRSYEHISTTQY